MIERFGNWLANLLIRCFPGVVSVETQERRALGLWGIIGLCSAILIFLISGIMRKFTVTPDPYTDWVLSGFGLGIVSEVTVLDEWTLLGGVTARILGIFFWLAIGGVTATVIAIYKSQHDPPVDEVELLTPDKRNAFQKDPYFEELRGVERFREDIQDWTIKNGIFNEPTDIKYYIREFLEDVVREWIKRNRVDGKEVQRFHDNHKTYPVVKDQVSKVFGVDYNDCDPGPKTDLGDTSILCDFGMYILEDLSGERLVEAIDEE